MKDLRLHNYWRSSASWRVRLGLNLKGLPFEYVAVHLLKDGGQQNSDAYRAVNPMRTVPTLEWTEADGTVRRLSQSLAILEFLQDHAPSPSLYPEDAYLRARARMLAEYVNSGMQPMQNLSVLQRIKAELNGDDKAWGAYWNTRGLEALEKMVQPTVGRFCVGDSVTLADVCLVPQLYGARRFALDLSPYPTLLRIEAACAEHPAFQASHPDRQPDATPG
ncbi:MULTISPECIES: maleylacetoacetate isomerase [Myxococcus]|uniref:Maleylacetoacetate isomerase n=1 Tax=Myxococcus llanfairpwllgwyngyllgogerychwyrndrobwllllantysiliogogogochensis TaxID=2590453 RepID=A0A540WLF1_9BACT|nr:MULTISPECIES: maleylacetoacetate isomerase [Myxococcus]NTX03449.1 maleylacetoacetate isomerase [Myxococcus sp. CA040A]NTX34043.1 maleylacetoacetate isomerase [Myxococcus sp. CA033]TQF09841.1 maleylacetoacetate isomerase [Myxococcus llanfairpwllgwyngyllgogerychwyrndrobwllllantysiliogogogochensis]